MILVVAVLVLIVAQTVIPAQLLYLAGRRYTSLPPHRVAALGLAAAPIVLGASLTIGAHCGCGWRAAVLMALACVGVITWRWRVCVEFARQHVARIWLATALFWVGQALLIYCPGIDGWTWDWIMHFNIAGQALARLQRGLWPVHPMRPLLLGVWTAPALAVSHSAYWAFTAAVPVASAEIIPAVALWGERLGGERGARYAPLLAVFCGGFAFWAVFPMPLIFATGLVLFGAYLYVTAVEAPTLRGQAVWNFAAGIALVAAFQAHPSVAWLIAALLAVGWFGIGNFPRLLALPALLLMAGWAYAVWQAFPNEAMAMVRDVFLQTPMAHHGTLWGTMTEHVRSSLFPPSISPVNWWPPLSGLLRDRIAVGTTGIFVLTFPAVGLAALATMRPRWRAADTVAACAVAIATLAAFAMYAGTGPFPQLMLPAYGFLFALASTGHLVRTRWLWPLTAVQYAAIRGLSLGLQVWPATANPNDLKIKHAEHVTMLVDQHAWAGPLAGLLVLAAGCWLFRHAWRCCEPECEKKEKGT